MQQVQRGAEHLVDALHPPIDLASRRNRIGPLAQSIQVAIARQAGQIDRPAITHLAAQQCAILAAGPIGDLAAHTVHASHGQLLLLGVRRW